MPAISISAPATPLIPSGLQADSSTFDARLRLEGRCPGGPGAVGELPAQRSGFWLALQGQRRFGSASRARYRGRLPLPQLEQKFGDEDILAIRRVPRKTKDVAEVYGVGKPYIRRSGQGVVRPLTQ